MNCGRAVVPAVEDVLAALPAAAPRAAVAGAFCRQPLIVTVSVRVCADGDTGVLPTVGMGAFLLLIGASVIGPVLAAPSVRIVGALLPKAGA